jgi:hypothetical protein
MLMTVDNLAKRGIHKDQIWRLYEAGTLFHFLRKKLFFECAVAKGILGVCQYVC